MKEAKIKKDSINNWLVVYTKHHAEKKLMNQLLDNHYEAYVPLYTSIRKWSDRKKKLDLPLINSVVFVKSNPKNFNALFKFNLVRGILREKGTPGIVKDKEIETLKLVAREWNGENVFKTNTKNLSPGDLVEVTRGQFKGVTGNLIEVNGKHRLIIQLNSINVQFVINMPVSNIKKIRPES